MSQHFGGEQQALGRCNAVSVQYKDRIWEIELENANGCMQSISLDLQAALNLAKPPVGLRLRVAPGAETVVCPLSVLVACPSFIATTFQGEQALLVVGIFGAKQNRFQIFDFGF